MTREEFFALPPILSFFPLVYPTGDRWNNIGGNCGRCDQIIRGEFFRGFVTKATSGAAYRDDDREVTYILAGHILCDSCKVITDFNYYLPQDMSMQGFKEDGYWYTSGPPKKTRWQRFKKWLKRG